MAFFSCDYKERNTRCINRKSRVSLNFKKLNKKPSCITSFSLSKKSSKMVLPPIYYNPKSYLYKKLEFAITNKATN